MATNEQEELEYLRLKSKASGEEAPAWKRVLSKAGGPALELGGLMGGEALGATGGAMTGPAAPVAMPILKTLGGAGGEAAGELGRKELDTILGFRKQPNFQEIMQTLKGGAGRGAMYSAGGQVLGGVAGSEFAKPVMDPIKKAAGAGFEMATGYPKKILSRFIENPFMKGAKSMEEAGSAYKAGRKAIMGDFKPTGVLGDEESGLYDEINKVSESQNHINDIHKALKRGEKVSEQELIPAREWINNRVKMLGQSGKKELSTMTAEAKQELIGLGKVKKLIDANLKDSTFWPKITDYAKAATKEEGSRILPGGYGGRYLARRSIPLLAGMMSPMTGAGIAASMSPKAWTTGASILSSGMANAPVLKIIDALRERRKRESLNP